MQLHRLVVPQQLRYATLGQLEPDTRDVWVVCHGYGQLVPYFIRHFQPLAEAGAFVVAPEGINRFYREGFSGRVGACWMTSEDRLTDIANHTAFLDGLYAELLAYTTARVTVLGFSQGGATVTRWLAQGQARFDRLILWAGELPADIPADTARQVFGRCPLDLVYGTADELIPDEAFATLRERLDGLPLAYRVHTFAGGHHIDGPTLQRVAALLP